MTREGKAGQAIGPVPAASEGIDHFASDQLDVEDQGRVGRDLALGPRPVAEFGRDGELPGSPTFMPGTPSSQPGMTWPLPMTTENGGLLPSASCRRPSRRSGSRCSGS